MVGGHVAALIWLGIAWKKLVPGSLESIQAFYGQIWNLFYYEYVLYLTL